MSLPKPIASGNCSGRNRQQGRLKGLETSATLPSTSMCRSREKEPRWDKDQALAARNLALRALAVAAMAARPVALIRASTG